MLVLGDEREGKLSIICTSYTVTGKPEWQSHDGAHIKYEIEKG